MRAPYSLCTDLQFPLLFLWLGYMSLTVHRLLKLEALSHVRLFPNVEYLFILSVLSLGNLQPSFACWFRNAFFSFLGSSRPRLGLLRKSANISERLKCKTPRILKRCDHNYTLPGLGGCDRLRGNHAWANRNPTTKPKKRQDICTT